MPGIVGIISRGLSAEQGRESIRSMLASLQHQPFYVSGEWSVPEDGIYLGWVAHPDSFAAAACGFSEDGQLGVAVAGECHSTVSKPGLRVPGPRDWLVEQYRELGERCVEWFNGLFSGFLWDRRERRGWLINDRFGAERLYWHDDGKAFWFSSEAKALLRVLPRLRAFDEEGVSQFLAFGCTLAERTLFQGIRLLPGGSRWSCLGEKGVRQGCYFTPDRWEALSPLTDEEYVAETQTVFRRILKRYTSDNSRLGLSLTGGLDTRMIAAGLGDGSLPAVSYTFSGRDERTIDARLAARIAAELGLPHHVLRIGKDFLADFARYVDRTVQITDGCAGLTGAHEIYFNQHARALAPVRLTGNFGSEVLRGMSTFKRVPLAEGLVSDDLSGRVKAVTAPSTRHPVTFAAFQEVPWKLFGTMAAARSEVAFRTPYLDNELVELAYRVPSHLRSSPMPALRFIQSANPTLAAIPTDRGQVGNCRGLVWASRRFFAEVTFKIDYYHKEGLPDRVGFLDPLLGAFGCLGILGLHKFLPYRRWLRQELSGYLKDQLSQLATIQSPFWNATFLERMAAEHIAGRKNYIAEINAVLTLAAVERSLLRSAVG